MKTVEEVLVDNNVFSKPEICNFNLIIHRDCYILAQHNIKRAAIEFAKLHVKEALKEAYRIALQEGLVTEAGIAYFENAYSLDNIK